MYLRIHTATRIVTLIDGNSLSHTRTRTYTRVHTHTQTRKETYTQKHITYTHFHTKNMHIIHTAPRIVTSIDGNSLPASSEAEYTDAPPLLCRVGEYTYNIPHNMVHVRNSDILEEKLGPIILMYRPRCVGCENTYTT